MNDPLAEALDTVSNVSDDNIRLRCLKLLNEIREYIVPGMPTLHAIECEDGSILFEWIGEKHRVGFSVEQNAIDDGFFMINPNIHQYGHLACAPIKALVTWFIENRGERPLEA